MFNAYMTDTVILIRKTGDSTWGEKAFTRTSVRARVEDKSYLIRSQSGEDKMVQAVVYFKETEVSVGDKIEVMGVEHPILTIRKNKAFSKTVVMEAGLG